MGRRAVRNAKSCSRCAASPNRNDRVLVLHKLAEKSILTY